MNRTIEDATVKRYRYDSHDRLRTLLGDFLAAYNFARRRLCCANGVEASFPLSPEGRIPRLS